MSIRVRFAWALSGVGLLVAMLVRGWAPSSGPPSPVPHPSPRITARTASVPRKIGRLKLLFEHRYPNYLSSFTLEGDESGGRYEVSKREYGKTVRARGTLQPGEIRRLVEQLEGFQVWSIPDVGVRSKGGTTRIELMVDDRSRTLEYTAWNSGVHQDLDYLLDRVRDEMLRWGRATDGHGQLQGDQCAAHGAPPS